jgi:transposase
VFYDVNSLHHVTRITPNKLADNNVSFRQRAVIEFLVKEEIPAAEIYQRLQRAYGSVCMGASSVRRWAKYFKDGNTSIEVEPRSGRPRTASTERNKKRVDELIQDNRRVTVDTIARKLGIGHSAAQEMIESNCKDGVGSSYTPLL